MRLVGAVGVVLVALCVLSPHPALAQKDSAPKSAPEKTGDDSQAPDQVSGAAEWDEAPRPDQAHGIEKGLDKGDWNLLPHIVAIYVLFPNTVLVWQLDHIELWQIFPGRTPDESAVELSLYTPEPTETERARAHWDKNFDLVVGVVEDEDFPVGEGIQNGFHSGAQPHITFGTNEPALAFFHRAVTDRTA